MNKAKIPFRAIWNSILGISLELVLVYLFIFVGLATCFAWWAISK